MSDYMLLAIAKRFFRILSLAVVTGVILGLILAWFAFPVRTVSAAPGFPIHTGGKVTVTTAGTRVQLTTTIENARSVYIEADEDNSGVIYVGSSSVTSDNYVSRLTAGQGWSISQDDGSPVINPRTIYIDAGTNTQSIQWGYF